MKKLLESIKQARVACEEVYMLNNEIIEEYRLFQRKMEIKIISKLIYDGKMGWREKVQVVNEKVAVYPILQEEAKRLSVEYGYSAESFYRVLFKKNIGRFPEEADYDVYHSFGKLKLWIL